MSSPYPRSVAASVTSTQWPLIGDALREFWPSVCAAARAYLAYFPQRALAADRLRIYLRPDSGSVYFAVCPGPPRDHYGEVACFTIPHVESEYFRLLSADEAFERGHSSLMSRLVCAIKNACSPELSPLAITIVEYDDLETERFLREVDSAPA